ncbi:signal transduction histidine kinase [Bosea sp. AK1]|uniref:sensor histidine kinase n=1 Tax=Bosea sp. AK1 TaxID=2587160 RepID=UPI0011510888|nr:ATP-binding protein [Bosea sp. AK1]TQI74751.1 signal transduction histidine kinase [Bosea sp. AK1]
MTPRFSIATRITLIVFSAVLAVWIVSLGFYYRSQDGEREGMPPAPSQVAAMADLLERLSGRERELALAAFGSEYLGVRLETADIPSAPNENPPARAAMREAYGAALGGRPVTIVSPVVERPRSLLSLLMPGVTGPPTLRITLSTGETLVIASRSPVLVTSFGLPVGFAAGLVGTLIALVALLVMHRATRPLMRLAVAFDAMDLSGDPLPLPASRTHPPEIQALINAYNRLQARLSQLLRARMALLGGISHDVRTFATRLRLRADHIPEGVHRERAIADIAAMILLLDDALLASRTGAGELAQEMVELAELLRLEVDDRRGAGMPVDLRLSGAARGATVLGDRLALRRIAANLIDNAIAYGHAAHLVLHADEPLLTLTVDDEGTGVAPELRDLLFEPFVRAENSRSRRTGGAGLGLAIARSLVEGHGGTIAVDDAPDGGARFTVKLPRFAAV